MTTRSKTVLAAGLLAAGLLQAVSASAENGVTEKEILIGESVPLSGPAAAVGVAHALGTRLAAAEANSAGGINGRAVRVLQEDDGYVPSRTVQNVRKLVDDDKIFALTNTSSSAGTLGLIDYLESSGVVMMNTFVNNSAVWTPPRRNIFSVGQGYPQLAYFTIKYMAKVNPGAKWALIVQDDDFGANLIEGANKALQELTTAPVEVVRYKRGQQDFSAEMLRIRNAGATAIYSGAISSENVSLTKEARRLNLKAAFGMVWTVHLAAVQQAMGEPGNGAVFAEYTTSLDEDASRPIRELAAKHLTEAERKNVNRTTLASYAATKLLFEAARRCGQDLTRTCTIREIEATKNFETGAMAPISFGPGVRFSDQKLRILQNDFAGKRFLPLTQFE